MLVAPCFAATVAALVLGGASLTLSQEVANAAPNSRLVAISQAERISPSSPLLQEYVLGWNFTVVEQDGCNPIAEWLAVLIDAKRLRLAGLFSASNQTWMLYDPRAPSGLNALSELCKGDIVAIYIGLALSDGYSGPLRVGASVKVTNTDGSCLNSRAAPNEDILECLPADFRGTLDDGPLYVAGYWWWHIAGKGWSADPYLEPVDPGSQPPPSRPKIHFYNCTGPNGGFCGKTASGTQVGFGQASCDRSRLGWKFELEGHTFTCTDTGSGVKGEDIDIWFPSYEEGQAFMAQLGPNPQIRWHPA